MLKRFLFKGVIVFLCFIIIPITTIKVSANNLEISAKSYILMDKDSKTILASYNENE